MITYQQAEFDVSQRGTWRNTFHGKNFFLTDRRAKPAPFGRMRVVYTFRQNYDAPLLFEQDGGTQISISGPFETDMGSVPPIVSGWIPKDLTLGFLFHDFACLFGGLYFRYPGEHEWTFRLVRRWDADGLLGTLAMCDPHVPIGRMRAAAIVAACRAWGVVFGCGDEAPPEWGNGNGVSTQTKHV